MEDVLIEEIMRLHAQNERLSKKIARKGYHTAKTIAKKILRRSPQTASNIDENTHTPVEKGRVDIINMNFYDWDGKKVYKGGAERYVFDLAHVLQEMGYKPRILQGANIDFEKTYHGIKVIGVKSTAPNFWEVSRAFAKACQGAEFVISSPYELAEAIDYVPCIGINHSVRFDNPESKTLTELPKDLFNPYWMTIQALKTVKTCVCTDTNFVNWMRTRDHELSKKILYLPNYYDEKLFTPSKKLTQDKVVFIFPRRIEESRGHKLTIDAYRQVVKKYPNTELRIIGQYQDEQAQKDVEVLIAEYPDNVSHTEYEMEDSYKAFQDADVMLAPTVYMEGSSLSCIEALASGLPIIATTVGGLPNLVVDHFNGYLIPTTVDDLANAMIELIEHPDLRKKMGQRSLDMARAGFTKKLWQERWQHIIKRFVKENHL